MDRSILSEIRGYDSLSLAHWREAATVTKFTALVENLLLPKEARDAYRLSCLFDRIQAKMIYRDGKDPIKNIWNCCFDAKNLLRERKLLSPQEALVHLEHLSNDQFRQSYQSYDDRCWVAHLLSLAESLPGTELLLCRVREQMRLCERVLTQEDLPTLLSDLNLRGKHCGNRVSVKELLQRLGYRTELKDLDLCIPGIVRQRWGVGSGEESFKYLNFEGISFENCSLKWVNLSGSRLAKCQFRNCQLQRLVLGENCELDDVRFDACQLERSEFCAASLRNVHYTRCLLNGASFFDSELFDVHFTESATETCNFIGARIDSSCTLDQQTAAGPKIALWWGIDHPSPLGRNIEYALKNAGGIPMRCNHSPSGVSVGRLRSEVRDILSRLGQRDSTLSIAQACIRMAMEPDEGCSYPEFTKILHTAKIFVQNVHALVLPGGRDVEPEFYLNGVFSPDADYRRSLLELCTLHYARQRGIPVLGICRGLQLSAVYYGAQLREHVPGHVEKVQRFTLMQPGPTHGKGLVREALGQSVWTANFHHQAVDEDSIGSELEPIIKYEGVVKALEGTQGAPLTLYQWHPEAGTVPAGWMEWLLSKTLLSRSNRCIWTQLMQSSQMLVARKVN